MAGNDLKTPCRVCGTVLRYRRHIARREGASIIYRVVCIDCIKEGREWNG